MEAASDGYCRSCKKLFNREAKKHCVHLFGEKGSIFNPSSSNADEIARLNEFSELNLVPRALFPSGAPWGRGCSELAIFPSEMRNFK